MRGLASQTVSEIMRSSCAEFANNGLDGARIEDIARKAGTSKQLVYYYFGNKTGLYRATLEDIAERLIREFSAIDFDQMDPVTAIRAFINKVFDEHLVNLKSLTTDGALQRGLHVTKRSPVHRLYRLLVARLDDIILRGQREDLFIETLDSRQFYLMTVIICSGFMGSCELQSGLLGLDFGDEALSGFWRGYTCDFIVRSITANRC